MTIGKKIINLRKTAIALLGLYCILRGIAYLPLAAPNDTPQGVSLITEFLPLAAWGGIWLAIGIVCIIKTFTKTDGVAIPLATGLMAGWGAAYLYGWVDALIAGEPSRAWLTASSYLIPAIVIGILSAKGGEAIELE